MKGYIYRCESVDATTLHALIHQYVGLPCYHLSGTNLWQHPALQPLTHSDQPNTDSDFGHAFSDNAEVRWKRLDSNSYDVLILSEQTLNISNAKVLATDWDVREHRLRPIFQSGQRRAITYYTYHAPNGAAQYTRYLGEARK